MVLSLPTLPTRFLSFKANGWSVDLMLSQSLSDILPIGDFSDFLITWGQPEPSLYERSSPTSPSPRRPCTYLKLTSPDMENEALFVEDQCSLVRLCKERINTYVNETELGITTMAAVQVFGKL